MNRQEEDYTGSARLEDCFPSALGKAPGEVLADSVHQARAYLGSRPQPSPALRLKAYLARLDH